MNAPLFTPTEMLALSNAVTRAQTDEDFRQLVLDDLPAALEQVGLPLPDRRAVRESLVAAGLSDEELAKFDEASLDDAATAMRMRPQFAVQDGDVTAQSDNFYRGVSGFVPAAHWWGFHVPFAFDDIADIFKLAQAINSLVATLGGVIAKAAPPIKPFVLAILLYITVQVAVVTGVSAGCQRSGAKGTWVSMAWAAPGIFVPTCVC
ncbi:hypothetical protein ENSA5_40090 [Enhygromyxa salina]|uniref:Nif11 domain-containing protein n=1 Tax=Enhygromyxa salina TaxID=215803 RepID=A0A2S9XR65_9BACT|nr:hypothetical protein [Enhygromyxa salina]PRP95353.1 hypothetical protein ENSA5_40090 [Enhygromyxa salina]